MRTFNPKTKMLPPTRVTEAQDTEIRRRAEAARMTLADYLRERALGRVCPPVEPAPPKRVREAS